MIIGFQGSYGANSHISCKVNYPNLESKAYPTFYDVFKAVENGEIEYGMIPLENSYAGRVSEIHDLLQTSSVFIVAEHFLKISHNLCVKKGTNINDIKTIYSHPQALAQCQNNIRDLNTNIREFSNTALAAEFVAKSPDNSIAAICSQEAAKIYDLEILKTNFQDLADGNITIFIVISNKQIDISDDYQKICLTTILFTIRNIPGSLYKALGGFATNNVNMVKLESYIPGGFSKQAKFFITIEGHPNQRNVGLALEEMGFFSKNVKLLGIYYADKSRNQES